MLVVMEISVPSGGGARSLRQSSSALKSGWPRLDSPLRPESLPNSPVDARPRTDEHVARRRRAVRDVRGGSGGGPPRRRCRDERPQLRCAAGGSLLLDDPVSFPNPAGGGGPPSGG